MLCALYLASQSVLVKVFLFEAYDLDEEFGGDICNFGDSGGILNSSHKYHLFSNVSVSIGYIIL